MRPPPRTCTTTRERCSLNPTLKGNVARFLIVCCMINSISDVRMDQFVHMTKSQTYKAVLHVSHTLIPSSHTDWSKLHEYSHKRLVKKCISSFISLFYWLMQNNISWKKSKPDLLKERRVCATTGLSEHLKYSWAC